MLCFTYILNNSYTVRTKDSKNKQNKVGLGMHKFLLKKKYLVKE